MSLRALLVFGSVWLVARLHQVSIATSTFAYSRRFMASPGVLLRRPSLVENQSCVSVCVCVRFSRKPFCCLVSRGNQKEPGPKSGVPNLEFQLWFSRASAAHTVGPFNRYQPWVPHWRCPVPHGPKSKRRKQRRKQRRKKDPLVDVNTWGTF